MNYLRSIINCLSNFCDCLRCSEESGTQGLEPNERTHLLVDPVNSSPAIRRTNSDNLSNEYSQSLPKRDEQTALNRIVQNTALNVIDVAAMDSHNLEIHEYNERVRVYSQRLQHQWSNIKHPNSSPSGLLKDIPNPEYYLTQTPISAPDLSMIKIAVSKIHSSLEETNIEPIELVVPFRIPSVK